MESSQKCFLPKMTLTNTDTDRILTVLFRTLWWWVGRAQRSLLRGVLYQNFVAGDMKKKNFFLSLFVIIPRATKSDIFSIKGK